MSVWSSLVRLGILAALLAVFMTIAAQATHARSTVVIRLVSKPTQTRSSDRPPKGASPGDKIVSSDRLTNAVAQLGRPKGAVVGSDRGTFTLLKGNRTRLEGWTTLP